MLLVVVVLHIGDGRESILLHCLIVLRQRTRSLPPLLPKTSTTTTTDYRPSPIDM